MFVLGFRIIEVLFYFVLIHLLWHFVLHFPLHVSSYYLASLEKEKIFIVLGVRPCDTCITYVVISKYCGILNFCIDRLENKLTCELL